MAVRSVAGSVSGAHGGDRRRLHAVADAQPERLAARHGLTGVAPFVGSAGVQAVPLLGGDGTSGYARAGRWAVTPGDVLAPCGRRDEALTEYLAVLADRRLRPTFLAVGEPEPYRRRGMHAVEVADEATLALQTFTLAGSRRANLRHSTTSARRAGLTVRPFEPQYEQQIADISAEWLRTKRGGEFGFTLSRHDEVVRQVADGTADLWVTLDGEGVVQAWCTWRPYLDGTGRVLDVMRRRVQAPNPAMDALLCTVLENYRDAGLVEASLASVPRSHGELAERVFPARSLRAYKQKFDPQWSPRWLAVPARRHLLPALAAVGRAYCGGGLGRALFRNR